MTDATALPRILFVDDEPNVLQGMQRMLYKMRNQWEMAFASSAAKALDLFRTRRFDVVVSDMRMPEMDGAELLARIKAEWPEVVRIVLSGYSEYEAVMRTVGPAHQYLAKPCDSDRIVATVTRALKLRSYLHSSQLRQVLAGMGPLPSPPQSYMALVQEFDRSTASVASVSDIIGRDVAMSAAVLKMVNSPFFGFSSEVNVPMQAVRLLGFDLIRSLVLRVGIFRHFEGNRFLEKRIEAISEESLIYVKAVRLISQSLRLSERSRDQATCAALLSEIGILVMLDYSPERFDGATHVGSQGADVVTAERKYFNASHCEIGAYLLGLWGFSDPVVEAVAFHHEPQRAMDNEPSATTALHIVQTVCRAVRNRVGKNEPVPELDLSYLKKIGVEADVAKFRNLCTSAFDGVN
jgi:HD-like signal output (HDOD) protein/CheY-like chemotaxis protein